MIEVVFATVGVIILWAPFLPQLDEESVEGLILRYLGLNTSVELCKSINHTTGGQKNCSSDSTSSANAFYFAKFGYFYLAMTVLFTIILELLISMAFLICRYSKYAGNEIRGLMPYFDPPKPVKMCRISRIY